MAKRLLQGSWIEHFMDLGKDQEAPMIYFKWAGLVFVASALQRRVWLQRPMYRDYPNMYVIFVAPPGKTRKSTAGDWGYGQIVKKVPGIRRYSGRITTEALCEELLDYTACVNGSVLETNCSMLLYASELSELLEKTPKGCYPIVQFLTRVYGSGDEFTYKTKSGGKVSLTNVCINLFGATTPEGVHRLIGKAGVEGGFASRVIFIYQDVANPKPWAALDVTTHQRIDMLVHDLQCITALEGEMKVPVECIRWFDSWYIPQAHKVPVPELVHYWSRRHDHLLKVAMLLAVAERDNLTLSVQDLIDAKVILEEVEKTMHLAFRNVERTNNSYKSELIIDYMREQGKEVPHSRLLRRFQHRFSGSKEFNDVIASLIESDQVEKHLSLSGKGSRYTLAS